MDIETYEENNKVIPYCVCICLNNKYSSFYFNDNSNIIEEFLIYILNNSDSNNMEFFIHNLNFDGMLIIEYLTISKILFKIKSIDTNLYWIEIYYIKKKIILRCSYKIIPLSLKKIGILESFEKTLFPYKFINYNTIYYKGLLPDKAYWNDGEYEIFSKDFKGEYDVKEETIKYCINDIKLLKKCLLNLFKIIKEIDKKVLEKSYSAPSISHKLFFKYFNISGIDKNIEKKNDIYIRKAYKGGRCEVFGNPLDNEIIKYYDFPGMYGICMKEKFHNGKHKFTTEADISKTGFHTITYQTTEDNIPILPSHSEKGKLLFANGINTDTVWFEELIYFVENGGRIIKKHHSLIYDEFNEVFKDFVEYFEKIKVNGGYYKIFGKLMINSLYGSMALKDENILNYITFSYSEFEYINKLLTVKKFYKVNDIYIITIIKDFKFKKLFKDKKDYERSIRNVSYSAAISSKARIKLHKFFINVIKDGGRLLYSDTDSIFAAYPSNDLRNKIGENVWEKMYQDAVFVSPKSYALKLENESTIKIKGVSIKNTSFEDFKNKFYNNENIEFDLQKINAKKNFILNQKILSKNINLNLYDKRKFSINKKFTEPLQIINTHAYNE